ncbi:MAG: translocation/assembly module TamB [Myxococcota bacterium]|nr:translocation/assembly module TamB [Myxococcota bacterium]
MARRIGIAVIVVVAVIGLFVTALLAWASSPTGTRRLADELRESLHRQLGIDAFFSELDLGILPPRIGISGIRVEAPALGISCRAQEAEFSPEPLSLLSGVFEVQEIYLGSPDCVAELDEFEIDDLLAKPDKAAPPAPFPLERLMRFGAIALSEGNFSVRVHDPGRLGEIDASMEGLGLDLTGGDAAELRGLLGLFQVSWTDGEKKVDETVDTIELRAQITPSAVDVRHLNLRAKDLELHARDAHLPLPLWPKGPDVAELSLKVKLDALARLPLKLPLMSGEASFEGSAKVARDEKAQPLFSAKGKVSLSAARVDDFIIGNLLAKINLAPQGVAIEEARLEAASGHLDLAGYLAFDDSLSTSLALQLSGIELAELLENLTVTDAYVMQRTSGPVKLSGTLKPLKLKGDVDLDVRGHTVLSDSFRATAPPRVIHVPKVRVRGAVEVTDQYLVGTGLSVELGSTQLAVGARFDFDDPPTFDISARSEDFHLDDVRNVAGLELRGHGPLRCRITGVLWDPQIAGELAMKDLRIDNFAFDRVSAKVAFSDSVLSFPGTTGEWGQSRVSTENLIIDFGAKGGMRIRTKVDAEKVQVADLARMFAADLSPYGEMSGALSGRVSVKYAARSDNLEIEALVQHENLKALGERFGPGRANLRLDNGELTLTELVLSKGGGSIVVSGARARTGELSFVVVASGIEMESIDHPLPAQIGLSATAQALAVVEGSLEAPKVKLNVSLGRTQLRRSNYGPSTVEASVEKNVLQAQGTLLGELLTLEHAKVDFAQERFTLEAYCRDLDLLRLLDVDMGNHRAELIMTGDFDLSGKLSKTPEWTGQVDLTKLRASLDDFSLENEARVTLPAKAGSFSLKPVHLRGQGIAFDISGSFSEDEMNLQVDGAAELMRVASLVDAVSSAEGLLEFSVSARGPFSGPTLRGTASVRDARAVIAGLPHPLEQIFADVVMSPRVLRLTKASARFAGGTVGVEGEVRLQGSEVEDYWFRAEAEDISPTIMNNLRVVLSTTRGGLVLRSPRQSGALPSVTGDLEAEELKYTEDIRVLELKDLNVDRLSGKQVSVKRALLYDEDQDFVTFDVRLHGDRNLWARNNLFDADLVIDDVSYPLRVVGTNQRFGLLGRIRGRSGLVRFAGKSFEVQSASVDFTDPSRPDNPRFRVVADGQIRDWKVTLTAEGAVDEYVLKLSSQPYLSKEDIVFLVLTGLTKAENRQFGGNALSLGAPVLGQLGPGGAKIPVEVQIYSAYSEKAGTDTTRLALGRWLNKDIWMSISSSVGAEKDVSANVDYKINDWFAVTSGYENDNEGQVGNIGLDLKFRLEF